jgi:peptidoglycan/LPS O-acetylase OafA/YrhL
VTLFLLLVAIVIPVVLLLSEVTYRLVERPMISLGARLAAARSRAHAE